MPRLHHLPRGVRTAREFAVSQWEQGGFRITVGVAVPREENRKPDLTGAKL